MSEAATQLQVRFDRPDFCLDVDAAWDDRVAVIFGPSGSGKTTLFEAVLGLHPRARSRIRRRRFDYQSGTGAVHAPGRVTGESASQPGLLG